MDLTGERTLLSKDSQKTAGQNKSLGVGGSFGGAHMGGETNELENPFVGQTGKEKPFEETAVVSFTDNKRGKRLTEKPNEVIKAQPERGGTGPGHSGVYTTKDE